jgi:hypothetical protein
MESRSVWQEVAEVAPHHIRQDSARAIWRAYGRSAAALFLDGTPGSSWFAVLAARQNADYLLTTRGTTSPGPAPLGIGAATGTPSKHGGIQIEVQVEQQQLRHQVAAHPLLADVDSKSVQASIQRQFDASIILEDSAFRDFVGVLCKLSSEMVSM